MVLSTPRLPDPSIVTDVKLKSYLISLIRSLEQSIRSLIIDIPPSLSTNWTPTLYGSTSDPIVAYSINEGRIEKVGNVITVFAEIALSSLTSVGSGTLQIGKLPLISGTLNCEKGVTVFYQTSGFTTAPLKGRVVGDKIELDIATSNLTSTSSLTFVTIYNAQQN